MRQSNGWWLPDSDRYFADFTKDGFQLDHLDAALQHVTAWDCALDIGAHVGLWTRVMGDRFKLVVAFEAARDTFDCLVKNVSMPNVATHHLAVGNANQFVTIGDDPTREGNTGARFIRLGTGDVQMIPVDDLGLVNCNFMKIDVEGFEAGVLKGARKTIQQHWPVIIMETDKRFARARYGVPDQAATGLLIDWGYKVVEHIRPDKVFAHV